MKMIHKSSNYATQKEALGLCDNLVKNVKQVESLTDLEVVTPDVEDSERHHLHLVTRDVVHQYFMFGFEVVEGKCIFFFI